MRVYLFRLSLSEKSRDLFSTDGEIETRTEVLTNFFLLIGNLMVMGILS